MNSFLDDDIEELEDDEELDEEEEELVEETIEQDNTGYYSQDISEEKTEDIKNKKENKNNTKKDDNKEDKDNKKEDSIKDKENNKSTSDEPKNGVNNPNQDRLNNIKNKRNNINNNQNKRPNIGNSPKDASATPKSNNMAAKQALSKAAEAIKDGGDVKTATKEGIKAAGRQIVVDKVKKVLLSKYLWIFIAIVLFISAFFVVIIAAFADEDDDTVYVDSQYNYSAVEVEYTSENGNVQTTSIEDFTTGLSYQFLYDKLDELDEEAIQEAFKTANILSKSMILKAGGYKQGDSKIRINEKTSGLHYCNINNGCSIEGKNIPSMNSSLITFAKKAYDKGKYSIISNSKEAIVEYNDEVPQFNDDIATKVIDSIKSGKDYTEVFASVEELKQYNIYNITDYVETYSIDSSTLWWPIGSLEETSAGIYAGEPSAYKITTPYNAIDSLHSSAHAAIDIGNAGHGTKNVIISISNGVVTNVRSYCNNTGGTSDYYRKNCNGNADCCGNQVIVYYEQYDMYATYYHLAYNSITVKVGDRVVTGQKLGNMGSTGYSTGNHLHFALKVHGKSVNPLDYVSAERPRG